MEITAEELQVKIDNGEKIIVDLSAEWCSACKVMKPIFEKVSAENKTDVNMFTIDVEQNRDFAVKHGVRSIPTILVFENGSVKTSKVGALQEQQIKSLIDDLILN
jgi:thioredoxin 1